MTTPNPVSGGGVKVPSVHRAQLGHRGRIVQQREHREVRQVVAVLVHDLGFLAALGEVVDAGLLLREFLGHVGPLLL